MPLKLLWNGSGHQGYLSDGQSAFATKRRAAVHSHLGDLLVVLGIATLRQVDDGHVAVVEAHGQQLPELLVEVEGRHSGLEPAGSFRLRRALQREDAH